MNLPPDLRSVEGLIFAIDQTAIHDGPGVRLMIYLKGCPLYCLWCHSPESIDPQPQVVWYETRCVRCGKCVEVCPEGLRSPDTSGTSVPLVKHSPHRRDADATTVGPCRLCGACVEACEHNALEVKGCLTTAGRLVGEAVRLKPFFRRSGGGVTLSGGEPMLQPEFAYAIAALCREAGIHVALETAGHVHWARLRPMTRVVDLFLYDLKHADSAKHRAYTGVSNRPILDNLRRVVEAGCDVVLRVPLIPGYNDSPDDLLAIARAARARGVTQLTLLPFNPAAPGKWAWLRKPYPLQGAQRQTPEEVALLERVVQDEGLTLVPA
jgi:pyruvate formate lyase activating enzyme